MFIGILIVLALASPAHSAIITNPPPLRQDVNAIRSRFPHGQQVTAVAVMLEESDGFPEVIGDAGEKGLYQLMVAPACWREIACNVRAAYELWRERGWQPWTTFTSGKYRASLGRARRLLRLSGSSGGNRARSSIGSRTRASCRLVSPGTASFGVLVPGSMGPLVRRVQSRLGLSRSGIYDRRTFASVTSIQRAHGLLVDGKVGRQTACQLRINATGSRSPQERVSRHPGETTRQRLLATARALLGVPYVYGGASRSGLDCSGFTMLAYRAVGIRLPHYSGAQAARGYRVSAPRQGDLVWWPGHVAIYYGHGRVIGARHPGTVSQIYRMYGTPMFRRLIG